MQVMQKRRTNLDVEVTGVLVEVPDGRVVTVGDEKPCDPLSPPGVAAAPRDHAGH